MIRNHTLADIDRIIAIYTQEYLAMPDEIETLKEAEQVLVYDEGNIKGFAHIQENLGWKVKHLHRLEKITELSLSTGLRWQQKPSGSLSEKIHWRTKTTPIFSRQQVKWLARLWSKMERWSFCLQRRHIKARAMVGKYLSTALIGGWSKVAAW